MWRRDARRRERDLERELQAHLELETEERRLAGAGGREAQLAARRAFGNVTHIREEVRAMWSWTAWERAEQDVRYALRAMAKSPGFTAVAVLSLALGIGANTAIFTFVNAAMLKPLPYREAARIVALRQKRLQSGELTPVHPRSFVQWQERARSFEALAIAQAVPFNTEGIDGAEQVPGLWMTPDLFTVFGVAPARGRAFAAEEGLPRAAVRGEVPAGTTKIILSHGYWQRRFGGDPAAIGRTVPAGRGSATIIGVMPADFRVGNLSVDIYSPLQIDRARPEAVGSRSFLCFGRLRPGVTLDAAKAEMDVVAANTGREYAGEREFGAVVTGLRDFLVGENRRVLWILAAVTSVVLLIACVNLSSLLLTRGVARQSELALRVALGAGRRHIVQQLVIESLVLALAGGVVGLIFGWAGSRALASLAAGAVEFGQISNAGIDGRVLAFTVLLSGLTALLFGLVPAWRVSRLDLNASMKAQGRGAFGGRQQDRLRGALVIAEVALATVLLVGAGLLLRSLLNLGAVRLGFQPEHAITLRTLVTGSPAARAKLTEEILARVEILPGVMAAGTIQFLPLSGVTNQGPFHFVGQAAAAGAEQMESDVSTVSRGYFEAIGMELVRGRAFARSDALESPRVAVVNRAFVARYSPGQDPIGRVILGDWANPKPTEIVGVVNDIRHNGLTAEPRPTVFLAQSQVPGYITYLVVRTSAEPGGLVPAIRREVRQIDRHQPFTDVQPLTQYVARALARPRLYANFVAGFASLALLLASLGIYGLLAHAVSQRIREIGLRIALGASPRDVLASTVWKGARLVLAGLAIGSMAAVIVSRAITRFLFGVEPADPGTYLAAGALLVMVALAAAYVPARRAARIDPIVALRYE